MVQTTQADISIFYPPAYGPDSRPPMAIFELLDYIVNEVSVPTILPHPDML